MVKDQAGLVILLSVASLVSACSITAIFGTLHHHGSHVATNPEAGISTGADIFSFCVKLLPDLQLDEMKEQIAYQHAAMVKASAALDVSNCFRLWNSILSNSDLL